MRESVEFQGEKARYKVTQFGALEGQRVLLRLSKMIGPAIGRAANGPNANVEVGVVLEEAFSSLDDAMVEELAERLARATTFTEDGKAWKPLDKHYDDFFAGNYVELMRWFRGALEVNYKDFLAELKAAVATHSK